MSILYSSDKQPAHLLKRVLTLTFEHARNLAYFAALYKLLLALGRFMEAQASGKAITVAAGKPALPWHAAVAGAIGASMVWSRYSNVNLQIVLYLFSRVIIGASRLLAKHGVAPFARFSFSQTYPWLAAGTWAAVMYMYETDPGVLHPSLTQSMHDIYRDSNADTPLSALAFNLPTSAVLAAMLWQTWPQWRSLFRVTTASLGAVGS
jgi:peroxisomal membrane protein 4